MKKAKEILKKLKLRSTLQRVAITEILLRKNKFMLQLTRQKKC